MKTPSIIEFTTDPQLLGLSISLAQDVTLRAAYGLPLATSSHRDVWDLIAGGRPYREGHAPSELTCIFGARSGKGSGVQAPILAYESVFGGHEHHLHRGERGLVVLVSQDMRATAISKGYLFTYFKTSPLLRTMIADERVNELDLTNGITIACFPCTKSSLRGYSSPAAGLDEVGFWRLEGSANQDVEVLASVRRGMISFPNAKVVKTSTPYTRSGVLFNDFQRAFGVDDPDLLVLRGPSALFNPDIAEARLDRERRLDPLRFSREFEAEFSDDLQALFDYQTLTDCVDAGVHERAYDATHKYAAFCDAASGEKKGGDRFTMAIAHAEGDRVVLDVLRIWTPKFSPGGVIREIADVLGAYRLRTISGDKWSPGFVREGFQAQSVAYLPSERDKSSIYLEFLPLATTGQAVLLDNVDLLRELRGLERRRGSAGGRDRVDHAPGAHDDAANSVCGALVLAASGARRMAPEMITAVLRCGADVPDPLYSGRGKFAPDSSGSRFRPDSAPESRRSRDDF